MKQKIIPKKEYFDDEEEDSPMGLTVNLDDLMEVGIIKEESRSDSEYDSDVSAKI